MADKLKPKYYVAGKSTDGTTAIRVEENHYIYDFAYVPNNHAVTIILKACNNYEPMLDTLKGILALCNGYAPLDKDFLREHIEARIHQAEMPR